VSRRLQRQWRDLGARVFPERQIIFRTRGDVRYVALSGRVQAGLAVVVLAFAGWVGYASVNAIYRDALLESRDRKIAELQIAYDRLASDFKRNEENFLVATRDLEDRYRRLHELAQRNGMTPSTADAAPAAGNGDAKQAGKAAPKPEAAKPEATKTAEAKAAETKPTEAKAEPAKSDTPAKAESAKPAQLASAAPVAPVAAARLARDTTEATANAEDLDAMVKASRQKAAQAAPKAGEIEARVLSLRGRQREVVEDLNQRTERSLAELDKALRSTGLDLDQMLRRHAEARAEVGVGGPLRAVADAAAPQAGEFDSASLPAPMVNADPITRDMNRLESKLGRWGDLMALAQRLPLSLPMAADQAELSSGFGRRTDPFTRQTAFHAGLDLIGPRQSNILASAPGVVVFAGRKGPYGRTVEIDHGLGVKTRYAHLSAIGVQVGETIAFGRRLGAMGSTGRSTGQHLHYEILIDDEPVDPSKFIEAGYHVFKQQEEPVARQ